MKIDITGRHIDITPSLRDYATEKLDKLRKLLDDPVDIHVVLFIEKHRHVADIQVKSRAGVFSGREETGDLYHSINEVVEKLERQARRQKEKVTDKRRRTGIRAPDAAVALNLEGPATPAEVEAEEREQDPIHKRIVRSEQYRLKPMSPEDAVLELEAHGEDVVVFRDFQSSRILVVHRLEDGNFGLIDPES